MTIKERAAEIYNNLTLHSGDELDHNYLRDSEDIETALLAVVEALPVVNPKSLQIFEAADGNGFDVHGAIKEPYSVGWIGTFLHKAEAESYIQALTARATLAAKDAGKEVGNGNS